MASAELKDFQILIVMLFQWDSVVFWGCSGSGTKTNINHQVNVRSLSLGSSFSLIIGLDQTVLAVFTQPHVSTIILYALLPNAAQTVIQQDLPVWTKTDSTELLFCPWINDLLMQVYNHLSIIIKKNMHALQCSNLKHWSRLVSISEGKKDRSVAVNMLNRSDDFK